MKGQKISTDTFISIRVPTVLIGVDLLVGPNEPDNKDVSPSPCGSIDDDG
jgi:hypothetical protein